MAAFLRFSIHSSHSELTMVERESLEVQLTREQRREDSGAEWAPRTTGVFTLLKNKLLGVGYSDQRSPPLGACSRNAQADRASSV